ncbi:MAG: hypothetical protein AB6733_10900 [Clostridiaceae bacterium]
MMPLNPEVFKKMTSEELVQYCKAELDEVNKREGMTRQARRKHQRDFSDMEKAIKSLSPHQMKLVKALGETLAMNISQEYCEKATRVMEEATMAALVMVGSSNEQIKFFMDKIYSIVFEEAEISNKFNEKWGNAQMATKKLEEMMILAETIAKDLIVKGEKQNVIIEILCSKMPLLSKSKAAKVISNVKDEMKSEKNDIEELEKEVAVEEIAKVILNEDKKTISEVKAIKKSEDPVKVKKEVKEEKSVFKKSNLKIKSVVVEGSNGVYTKEGESVTLKRKELSLQFNSKEEVMDFVAEIYEVFAM